MKLMVIHMTLIIKNRFFGHRPYLFAHMAPGDFTVTSILDRIEAGPDQPVKHIGYQITV